jgi:hypothetical protein
MRGTSRSSEMGESCVQAFVDKSHPEIFSVTTLAPPSRRIATIQAEFTWQVMHSQAVHFDHPRTCEIASISTHLRPLPRPPPK